jgi:zinc transporter
MTRKGSPFSIAILLDGKGGASELSDKQVDDWSESDGILWVNVNLENKAGKKWLRENSNLGKTTLSILLAGETRPRSIAEPDGLIVIMRGINMNPGSVPDDMIAIRLAPEDPIRR